MFALPRRFHEAGVQRYGFHGLSYEFVSARLREAAPELASGRVIVAHLGNGASLCAINDGRSMASTMGFTAVDGLMMGTRSGSLDPGVLIHLMDAYGLDARGAGGPDLQALGPAGRLGDLVRHARAAGLVRARGGPGRRAVRLSRGARDRLDGRRPGRESTAWSSPAASARTTPRSARISSGAAAGWGWRWTRPPTGPGDGAADQPEISPAAAWVVPTDEERMIARHAAALLSLAPASS
jgi:acetate kinase